MLSLSFNYVNGSPYPRPGSFQAKCFTMIAGFLFKELVVRLAFGPSALSFSHNYTRYFSLRLITALALPPFRTIYSLIERRSLGDVYSRIGLRRDRSIEIISFIYALALSLITYKATSIYSKRILSSPPPLSKVLAIDLIVPRLMLFLTYQSRIELLHILPFFSLHFLTATFIRHRLHSIYSPPPSALRKCLVLVGGAIAADVATGGILLLASLADNIWNGRNRRGRDMPRHEPRIAPLSSSMFPPPVEAPPPPTAQTTTAQERSFNNLLKEYGESKDLDDKLRKACEMATTALGIKALQLQPDAQIVKNHSAILKTVFQDLQNKTANGPNFDKFCAEISKLGIEFVRKEK